ncbi:MAG: helix-turn-helix domain-containing protein [Pseudomonadota bacterium]|uniref:helix-turn-helix domain-containing protein n=1 Tax=Fodinicurvata fenggangensis TaxID=1121830 RepID=UPI001FDF2E19|nr:helix-turn-helix transcriptional regulator [Fodinicurvata fenggangensis]
MRIRQRRTELGYTQQQLAQRVGLTYQQIHKYERGTNRISVARLVDIAEALEIQIPYFFEDISTNQAPRPLTQPRLGLDMARNFSSIADPDCREALARLCRAVARASGT